MNLRTLLYGTVTLLALAGSANAAVVANLGVNPNSTTGAFQSPIGGVGGDGLGPFTDQVVFTLSGGPAFLTIASATNVFAKPSDIITNFNGSVWFTNNTVSLADDIRIIGPIAATPARPGRRRLINLLITVFLSLTRVRLLCGKNYPH